MAPEGGEGEEGASFMLAARALEGEVGVEKEWGGRGLGIDVIFEAKMCFPSFPTCPCYAPSTRISATPQVLAVARVTTTSLSSFRPKKTFRG